MESLNGLQKNPLDWLFHRENSKVRKREKTAEDRTIRLSFRDFVLSTFRDKKIRRHRAAKQETASEYSCPLISPSSSPPGIR
jgi:hypothetical protein